MRGTLFLYEKGGAPAERARIVQSEAEVRSEGGSGVGAPGGEEKKTAPIQRAEDI